MKNSPEDRSLAHGFFHTMVVMGSALALGCGGESRSLHDAPAGTAGMNTDGAGGGAGNSGVGGTGAMTLGGGAGTIALGGGAGGGSGGSGGSVSTGGTGGSAGMPPTLDCPPSQWTCQYGGCDRFDLSDTRYCTCDASRPQTPLDCGTEKTMVCFDGVEYNASGNVVSQHVPYECRCMDRQPDCATACQAFERTGPYVVRCTDSDPTAALDPTEPVLCGCAPVVLK